MNTPPPAAIWTFRIFKGLYKKLRGSKKKKSDGYKTVWVTPPKGRRPALGQAIHIFFQ